MSKPKALRILLVEDNVGDVLLTQEAIRDAGVALELHVVSDGVEALALLKREGPNFDAPRPDLILLDWYPPKMDGSESLTKSRCTRS